jgi:hypothetical protein
MKEICSSPANSNQNRSVLMKYINIMITLFQILVIVSCTGKDDFTTGDNFIEEKTRLSVIDTFEVEMSTVLLDSLSTSGTEIALVGNYHDNYFGSLNSVAYFRPGFKSFKPDETFIFDSASVALVYSGDSYGDTTALMSVSIYQLDEPITLDDDNYLYNNSGFDFSSNIIGSRAFYPEPHSADTLFISANSFGENLFALYMDKDDNVTSSDLFLKFLKGFVLKSDFGNSVIGFKSDASQTFLKIYYHLNNETSTESSEIIPFGLVTYQFNSVHCDYADSELAKFKTDNSELSSEETGNKVFMQAIVGFLPKIKFPTLQNITLENRWRILKAELVLEPVWQSGDLFPLPEKFCLYMTDKYNNLGNALTENDGSVIYSTLATDDLFNENTRYTIDITRFINDELSDGYFDSNDGLLIGLTESEMNKTLTRLMVECKESSVKLRLYYLTY